jgi:catechol 2,3-dioxygenase-like lactoylglutathione lyase family enzyme
LRVFAVVNRFLDESLIGDMGELKLDCGRKMKDKGRLRFGYSTRYACLGGTRYYLRSRLVFQMSIQVKQIDHVTIVVADLAATRRFYVDLLGMREVDRPAFDFAGAWYQAGSTQIHATTTSAAAGAAGWADQGATVVSRGHHFAFEVDDAAAAAQKLQEAGITIAAGPKHRPDGPLQVYLHDPDGHLVELFSK